MEFFGPKLDDLKNIFLGKYHFYVKKNWQILHSEKNGLFCDGLSSRKSPCCVSKIGNEKRFIKFAKSGDISNKVIFFAVQTKQRVDAFGLKIERSIKRGDFAENHKHILPSLCNVGDADAKMMKFVLSLKFRSCYANFF